MLNKPKFMSPSINMYGNEVVDLESDKIPFSCIVDGDEAITAWKITISKLSDNTLVFDSGKVTLQTPFFPINNRNQNVVFSVDLKDYISASTAFVNNAREYYWDISLWGSENDPLCTSVGEVFYANSTPTTVLYYSYDGGDNLYPLQEGSILNKRSIYFKSTYTQSEGIHMKRYGWRIIDTDNGAIVMDTITQNQIYGVKSNISCECKGLLNDTNYSIELYIETQTGFSMILNKVNFTVSYNVIKLEADFKISALDDTSGIMINWGDLRTTEGIVDGNPVSYSNNYPILADGEITKKKFTSDSMSINIPYDSSVVFSDTSNGKKLDIKEDSYIVLSFQFDKTFGETLFEISGVNEVSLPISRTLLYDKTNSSLKYIVQEGNVAVSNSVQISSESGEITWYIAILSPMTFVDGTYLAPLNVAEMFADEALFPSDSLYPTNADSGNSTLYPKIGEWDKRDET